MEILFVLAIFPYFASICAAILFYCSRMSHLNTPYISIKGTIVPTFITFIATYVLLTFFSFLTLVCYQGLRHEYADMLKKELKVPEIDKEK